MGNKRITAEYDMITAQPSMDRAREAVADPIDTIKRQVDHAAQRPIKVVDNRPGYFVWERVYALGDLGVYIAMIALFFVFTIIMHYAV